MWIILLNGFVIKEEKIETKKFQRKRHIPQQFLKVINIM